MIAAAQANRGGVVVLRAASPVDRRGPHEEIFSRLGGTQCVPVCVPARTQSQRAFEAVRTRYAPPEKCALGAYCVPNAYRPACTLERMA